MKHILFFMVLALAAQAQKTGDELLAMMHKRYYMAMCRNYTFSQRNNHYENDSLVGTSVWHESVGLPDKFRIIFGDSAKGNSVLFRNDSVYHFRAGALKKAEQDSNTLLLLLGGMYYRDLGDVKARLQQAGYDLSKLSEQTWMKNRVYVIGADQNEVEANQLWVDASTFKIVRIIEKMNEKDVMDMRFESHRPWCKGFVEDKVTFRRNGRLEQTEEYFNLQETEGFK